MSSLRDYFAGRAGKPNYTIFVPDPDRAKVEAASGGLNTVMYDDLSQPSIMVRVDKFRCEDIDAAYGSGVHPMFVHGGVEKSEVWIGKYLASIANNRALSLPSRDPANTINFDTARLRCTAKGTGWDLISNQMWAGIAMLCRDNDTMPFGNVYYGRESTAGRLIEHGIRQDLVRPGTASGSARTLTGSGPVSWSHDNTPWGIRDLCGNVWEWVSGLRLNNGEIQIIVSPVGADHGVSSTAWRAILQNGELVDPGTADTLKYDTTAANGTGSIRINTVITSQSDGSTSANEALESITPVSGVTVPAILKQLALAPAVSGLLSDRLYMRNLSERVPYRGGGWSHTSNAGVFSCILHGARSYTDTVIGFRPAFVSGL
jgi:hypothetical protein